MDKETRNAIERATQRGRRQLEDDFAAQLEGEFDVGRDGTVAEKASSHLSAVQVFQRERIVAAIEHKRSTGLSPEDAVRDYLRDAAFTTLNRFVALKMLEACELVQECITKGQQSGGYREFCGMAPGLPLLPDSAGYRLYLESLFDELSTEVKVLFDRRDPSSVLWPRRATFEQLLELLNATELACVWGEDETIGWVYQFFNGQDERRKMREESQAPRNSRELAVRNQFFTPRYVVQFLTDNTLGRIWYEMRGTKTALAEKCEYMVRKPGEEFAPRPKKDPRDLRVLDPACGSGHFLLYAFDLLIVIYEEAYGDPESPKSEATRKTLAEDYPNVDALRKAVPGLVLARNLHGVDIDPRCAQIAQLALWMRAQKANRDFGIGRAERAPIRRSNIVVAEPLVADDQLTKEFVAKLGDAELGRVFTSLVESLSLAGDLGLLLQVDQLVARQAKRGLTGDLFAQPEERIRAALGRFVHEEASATNTRRRLFADDAAHGVALLAVAEKKFDAVLMNPPFDEVTPAAKAALGSAYPDTKKYLYPAFVEWARNAVCDSGAIGALINRTALFLASFVAWRRTMLSESPPTLVADLGDGVAEGALIEVAACCFQPGALTAGDRSVAFFSVAGAQDKATRLRSLVAGNEGLFKKCRDFLSLPTASLSYWLTDDLLGLFSRLPKLARTDWTTHNGVQTSDDFRFVRCWWEKAADTSGKWRPFAKGGEYSRFYADLHLVHNGRSVFGDNLDYSDVALSRGLTWTYITTRPVSVRVLPDDSYLSHGGPGLCLKGENATALLSRLAICNSEAFAFLVEARMGASGKAARIYQTGVIGSTPVPEISSSSERILAELARHAWSLKRTLDTNNEISHAFLLPPGPRERITAIDTGVVERELIDTQAQIDNLAFSLYGISAEDRSTIEAPTKMVTSWEADTETETNNDADQGDDEAVGGTDSEALGSWLVGVAFGRFDPRLATGERVVPLEPGPFDPLPSRSPGMYPEGEEPAERPDILVDDEGHADDLAARAVAIAERVKVDAPENLRAWLAKEFFPLHIKMYSKSRRKAPIYWQLATRSGSYSVWLYLHAFSKDTFFRVQNDYVALKLAHEERRLESLTSELRDGATAAQRKQLAAHEALVEELRAFLDEVKRVAPLWKPNLDDGVIINFAPLWRLVPQNKAWQKELKSTWDALCEGKYDWAHLAMHFWPERVVPKCAKDRSLAIAHGLEDVFWVEGTDRKWTVRKTPTRRVDELVKERTSPAVKSALKSLLEAPVANGKSTGRKGGGRRRPAADEGDA
jgi:hypothetical protein